MKSLDMNDIRRVDLRKRSDDSRLFFGEDDPVITEQHHKDSCDINTILRNYNSDTLALHNAQFQGNYGDYTQFMDYVDAFNFIKETDEMFMTLPANLRTDFGNDPQRFLDFVSDPANSEAMKKYGLLNNNEPITNGAEAPTTVVQTTATDSST